jgi:hypothetical protein
LAPHLHQRGAQLHIAARLAAVRRLRAAAAVPTPTHSLGHGGYGGGGYGGGGGHGGGAESADGGLRERVAAEYFRVRALPDVALLAAAAAAAAAAASEGDGGGGGGGGGA